MSRQLSAALRHMDYLSTLRHDWDGNGTAAPTEAAVMAAVVFLEGVAKFLGAAWPKPQYDGGVTLEWDQPARVLSVSFLPDGRFDCIALRDEDEGIVWTHEAPR